MKKTNHLEKRQQQRGISPLMLEALLIYGNEVNQTDGAIRFVMTKRGAKKLEKDLKKVISKLGKLNSMFAVEVDNTLLTTGYQTKQYYVKY